MQGWQTSGKGGVDLSFAGQLRFSSGALTQFFSSFQAVPQANAELIGSTGTIHLDLPYVNQVGVTSKVRISRLRPDRSSGTFGDASSQNKLVRPGDRVTGGEGDQPAAGPARVRADEGGPGGGDWGGGGVKKDWGIGRQAAQELT